MPWFPSLHPRFTIPVHRNCRRLLCALALGASMASAMAQDMGPSAWLGLSAADLRSQQPGVEAVRRPQRLSSGARGTWQLPHMAWGERAFRATFYLSDKQVQRVELLLLDTGDQAGAAQYAQIVQSFAQTLGPGLAASASGPDAVMDSTVWAQNDRDVTVLRSGLPGQVRVRVVYKLRAERDGSEL